MALKLRRKGKVCSPEAAAELVKPGDCITVSGVVGWMYPSKVIRALEIRYLTTGEPGGLTLFEPFPTGLPAIEPLAQPGMIKRVIAGWMTSQPRLSEAIVNDEVEAYMFPLGTLAFLCQQIAAGRDGYLTKVGLGTYIDPANGGGRLNAVTTEEIVSRVQIAGEPYLWYKAFPIDVAIIRGTTVDEAGNLSLEEEHATMSAFNQAMAAKRSGGSVIVQAKRIVREGQIPARMVAVPGVLVDAIVIDPEQHPDEANPELDWLLPSDRVPRPPTEILVSEDKDAWREWMHEGRVVERISKKPRDLGPDMLIARRAALEICRGDVVNVGAGVSVRNLIPVCVEEGVDEECLLSLETGHLGGWVNGKHFRAGTTSILDTPSIFAFYGGGLIDRTFLSMIDFDVQGSVNLLRYGDTLVGPGGSMDIAENVRRITFCATFSAGGLRESVVDGALRIEQEGRTPRLKQQIQHVCFNGPDLMREGKEVRYITERAVFQLTEDGLVLSEVAPGIDPERHIFAPLGFRVPVSPSLTTMDPRVFRDALMGLWT